MSLLSTFGLNNADHTGMMFKVNRRDMQEFIFPDAGTSR
jgi:hypothetical protein